MAVVEAVLGLVENWVALEGLVAVLRVVLALRALERLSVRLRAVQELLAEHSWRVGLLEFLAPLRLLAERRHIRVCSSAAGTPIGIVPTARAFSSPTQKAVAAAGVITEVVAAETARLTDSPTAAVVAVVVDLRMLMAM